MQHVSYYHLIFMKKTITILMVVLLNCHFLEASDNKINKNSIEMRIAILNFSSEPANLNIPLADFIRTDLFNRDIFTIVERD